MRCSFWCVASNVAWAVQVTDGDGRVLITAVGPRSEWGLIMDKVTVEEQEETPLQQKLGMQLFLGIPACSQQSAIFSHWQLSIDIKPPVPHPLRL